MILYLSLIHISYSEKDNLEYCEKKGIKNVSKLSKTVTHGNGKNKEDFEYNKDAGMYVCKAGHMAIRKAKQGKKEDGTQVKCYYFDVDKCKHLSLIHIYQNEYIDGLLLGNYSFNPENIVNFVRNFKKSTRLDKSIHN